MTHGALFNGIAGFPLAAAWSGIETIWTVEINEFCNKVSKKHFPNATQYTDIRHCKKLPPVDIISTGFPCQPYSTAGKQRGSEDERALWPEVLRIIRETRPPYIIGENVAGIIELGLDQVLSSLEVEGYSWEAFIVPACAKGAPHRRDRVWITAYSDSCSNPRASQQNASQGQQEWIPERNKVRQPVEPVGLWRYRLSQAQPGGFPLTESPFFSPDDGVSPELVRDRSKHQKAYGNAIVPQVAFEFFKAIKEIESAKQSSNQAA